jgi:subtilisin
VLNLSLGLPGFWDDFGPVIDRIRSKGILPVFAVGNEGPDSSRSPGNHAAAVSVGAVGRDGRVALTSSSQRFERDDDPIVPDLVMPGVEIVSADAGGGYRADDGTSAAAPFVSGLAALLWEAVPTASVDDVEAAIFESCTRPRRLAKSRANRGIPDAALALANLQVRAGVAARAAGGT